MRSGASYLFILTHLVFIFGCGSRTENKNKDILTADDVVVSSLISLGPDTARRNVENIIALADCVSPGGKYTTEVHADTGGYMLFRQEYTYKPAPFEAVIENDTIGYSMDDPSARLSKEMVYGIRSHAFHLVLLQLQQRFHSFSKPVTVQNDSVILYRITAKDELKNDCTLYFDRTTGLLSVLEILNPDNKQEVIRTVFTDWRKTGDILLPYHIDIYQGSKWFTFDFIRIDINSLSFKKKVRPVN